MRPGSDRHLDRIDQKMGNVEKKTSAPQNGKK
jgi:hypothetical protein